MRAASGSLACPVLSYHSQNIFANRYGENDHISLAADLHTLQSIGKRIVPLAWLVDWLLGKRPDTDLKDAVCITFDDGCNLEVFDLEFPEYGKQQSFISILKQFKQQYRSAGQADLQATTFVIACPEVRREIDTEALFGKGWMSDDWWAATQRDGILDIQNHSWDHKHPAKVGAGQDERIHDRFDTVDTFDECELQVRQASEFIAAKAQRQRPEFFAYPYGASSRYIRETYFPEQARSLGILAAFSATPGHITPQSDRWDLPRYFCGRDWKTPEHLLRLLDRPIGKRANGD